MRIIYSLWALLLCIELPLIAFAGYEPSTINIVLRNIVLSFFLIEKALDS